LQNKRLNFFILKPPSKKWWFFLYLCPMEKEHLIFGIRAIIEAIQAGAAVDKVFIQKEISGE
jgi:23S rRNA (guanosine2251-2'-O)-methyltransferase